MHCTLSITIPLLLPGRADELIEWNANLLRYLRPQVVNFKNVRFFGPQQCEAGETPAPQHFTAHMTSQAFSRLPLPFGVPVPAVVGMRF